MAFTNFSKPNIVRRGAVAIAKPVVMKINRNITIRSTLGHMLTFEKDVPMPVPPIMVRSCAEVGAERVDGVDVFKEPEEDATVQPVDPGQRLEDIREAIERIVERNITKEFTAAGIPSVPTVSKEVGYRVDRTEVAKAWRDRSEDLANDT
jgi:hypothetical protein